MNEHKTLLPAMVPSIMTTVVNDPNGRFGGRLGTLTDAVLRHTTDYLSVPEMRTLRTTDRSMYRFVNHVHSDYIVLILDNSGSMTRSSKTPHLSRLRRMVQLVQELCASWATTTRILVLFVSPVAHTSLAPYHNKVVSTDTLRTVICSLLLMAPLGNSTNLCECLLTMEHVGPTVVITDGAETEYTRADQLYHRRLPSRSPEQQKLLISRAIELYNTNNADKILPTTPAFTTLLILLRVFNPQYFLCAVVQAGQSAVPGDQLDDELVIHYDAQDALLVQNINASTIPLESGGPANISVPRAETIRTQAVRIKKLPRMREIILESGTIYKDTKDTFRIMLSHRFSQLFAGSSSCPGSVRELGVCTSHRHRFGFINLHAKTMETELLQTRDRRITLCNTLYAQAHILTQVRNLNIRFYLTKVKEKKRKYKDLRVLNEEELHLLLMPPPFHSPLYPRYTAIKTQVEVYGFNFRKPVDWLSVHMTLIQLGIDSDHPQDTLHEHLMRQDSTPSERKEIEASIERKEIEESTPRKRELEDQERRDAERHRIRDIDRDRMRDRARDERRDRMRDEMRDRMNLL